MYTYGPNEGKEVRDPDRYLSGVIGGLRKLAQSGLTEEESTRMVELAMQGTRLSYKPCTGYGRKGRCTYGGQCENVHVTGITE